MVKTRVSALLLASLLGLFFSPARLRAGDPPLRFDVFYSDQGLSQNAVSALAQDETGFLWAGTYDGLNRFDGYGFEVFREGLDGDIKSLLAASDGTLWVGTQARGVFLGREGLLSGARGQMVFTPLEMEETQINALAEVRGGQVWIGTPEGLLSWLPQEGLVEMILPDELKKSNVKALLADPLGNLWAGLDSGLWLYTARGVWQKILSEDISALAWMKEQESLAAAGRNTLWRINRERRIFPLFPEEPLPAVNTLMEDSRRHLWIGTEEGLYQGTLDGDLIRFRSNAYNPESLSSDRILSLREDSGGILWVGTAMGLNKMVPAKNQFLAYSKIPGREDTMGGQDVWSVYQDSRGRLWVGSRDGGIDRFYPGDHRFESHTDRILGDKGRRVLSLFLDDQDQFWVGSRRGGVTRYSMATGERRHYDQWETLWCFAQDQRGALWGGTHGQGLVCLDPGEKGSPDLKDKVYLSGEMVVMIHPDPWDSRVFWVGTLGSGLYRFLPESGVITPVAEELLGDKRIWALHQSSPGDLWIGTLGEGLYSLSLQGGETLRYTEEEGLANDVIHRILPDGAGSLWLSTNSGISRLDTKSGGIENYGYSRGVQRGEFNPGAGTVLRDGRLLFGGDWGITLFDPGAVTRETRQPPVVIRDVSGISGSLLEGLQVREGKDLLSVSFREPVITIELAALDYSSPDRVHYRYRLKGRNSSWIDNGSRRFISFSHLAGGHYTFEYQGTNRAGVWPSEKGEITLNISRAPWNSGAARMGYFLLVLILFGLLFWWFLARRENRLFRIYMDVVEVLNSSLELDKVMEILLERLNLNLTLDNASLQLIEGDQMKILRVQDQQGNRSTEIAFPLAEDEVYQSVSREGKPLLIPDTRRDGRFKGYLESSSLRSFLGLPLVVKGEVRGLLTVGRYRSGGFSPALTGLLEQVASHAAVALENARLFEQMCDMATHDGLTGLNNRRHLAELADTEMGKAARYTRPLCAMMLDLDKFKVVNDQFGHDVGDDVLKATAQVLQKVLRDTDLMGRYGGEEFVVLLPETNLIDGSRIAERICRSVETMGEEGASEKELPPVTISIGITEWDMAETLDKLLSRADKALYRSKEEGRNRVSILSASSSEA